MSRRRKTNSYNPSTTKQALDQLCDQKLPGGCDDCNAYQRMKLVDGIYRVSVYHDDGCPYLNGVTR